MTASTTPRTTPMAMATTVSSSVSTSPCRMRPENSVSPTTPHSKRGLVASERISAAETTSTTAAATHRPGWRTGTASIASGGTRSAVVDAVVLMRTRASALSAVDRGARNGAALDAPLAEDLLVLPVRDDLLDGGEDRLVEPAALRQRDAVGSGAVRLADDLELAARLLHRVVGDG